MILQALHAYYDLLIEDQDSGVAKPGYGVANVSHVLVLNIDGDLIDIYSISEIKNKKTISRSMILPGQSDHTVAINAFYLCDNASYVLGLESSKEQVLINKAKFIDFQQKNLELLQNVSGNEVQAMKNFLQKWNPDTAAEHVVLIPRLDEILQRKNILIFKLDGAINYIHESPEVNETWVSYILRDMAKAEDEPRSGEKQEVWGQCLVTGQYASIAPTHRKINGVIGAQGAGASLVSFNMDSVYSYGKEQSFNAPVSKGAVFSYTTALNYLLSSGNNRMRLRDMTVVFWADKLGAKKEMKVLNWTLEPFFVEENDEETSEKNKERPRRIDPATAREAKKVLQSVRTGKVADDVEINLGVRCYILGLAPNNGRLSVRFWQVNTLGEIIGKIAQHYADMEIVGLERWGGMITPYWTLKALAVRKEDKNIPPQLEGQLMESILTGGMYPQTLLNMAISRFRTGGEFGGVTPERAAIIKAFLLRLDRKKNKNLKVKETIHMSLNENHPSTAYQLGRLFSLLEKAQRDASTSVTKETINSTIRDRYFSSASATPGAVFPLLIKLAQHHMAKSRAGDISDRKIRDYTDPKICDVLDRVETFPAHLSLEEQGLFILGYYHQNKENYTKKEKVNKDEVKTDEGS